MTNFSKNHGFRSNDLVDILSHRASTQGEQRAISFLVDGKQEQEDVSYRELDYLARAIAIRLQAICFKGDRVVLLYPQGLDFIAAFFGCLYAGVIAVPINPPRNNRSIKPFKVLYDDVRPAVILSTTKIIENLNEHIHHDQWLPTDYLRQSEIKPGDVASWKKPEITGDSLAFLQYTSGSTSKPKGVMISHGNIIGNTSLFYERYFKFENSVIVTWLPFFHDMGMMGGILTPVFGGIPAIIMSPIDFLKKPYLWLTAIAHHKATFSGGPNFAYDLCIKKITSKQIDSLDLSHWKVAINGAEPVRSETIKRFIETFERAGFRKETFYPSYGLAEATCFVSGGSTAKEPVIASVSSDGLKANRFKESQNGELTQQLVGCGSKLAGHHLKIVDPDSWRELPEDRIGEVWAAGESVALGYWNKPAETNQTFRPQIKDSDDENLYLRTGDLGALHKGELYITGRLKDMLKIRGQNHYPHDIEETVQNSHSMLSNELNAAFSVEKKNEEKLVIIQEIKWFKQNGYSFPEIRGDIQQALMETHGLRLLKVIFVKRGSIPMTSSGKVKRRACCQLFLDNKFEKFTHEKVAITEINDKECNASHPNCEVKI